MVSASLTVCLTLSQIWNSGLDTFSALELHKLNSVQTNLNFGEKGQEYITSRSLEMVNVRFPLPYYTSFEYKSFLINY